MFAVEGGENGDGRRVHHLACLRQLDGLERARCRRDRGLDRETLGRRAANVAVEPRHPMKRSIPVQSAQSAEDQLLDGITTITPRLRYLTFRAWIISRYWHGRQPNRWKTFVEFAARQEAALALGLAASDYRGTTIIGISEARNQIKEGNGRLQIVRLTAQTATAIYATSSDTLALSDWTTSGIPRLSDTGNDLAELAEERIAKTKYARRIHRDPNANEVTSSELIDFSKAFDPDNFIPKERNILIDAIAASMPTSTV